MMDWDEFKEVVTERFGLTKDETTRRFYDLKPQAKEQA